jgi:ATP-binding cassette subfamily C protein
VTIPGFSDLELWQSLFVLMIAPDYFAPFRRFSEQYHAKAEGLAAAAALDKLLASRELSSPRLPALERVPFHLPGSGLVAVVGPSGCGKSTLLRRIAGIEPGSADGGIAGRPIVWVATDSHVPPGTLGEAIAWNAGPVTPDSLHEAAAAVGLLDDALLPGGLARPLQNGGADLSGGQRLRVAVARAVLADRTVLADEPTAKLDWQTAALVRRVLVGMAASRLVVVATHDRHLAAAADQVIDLSGQQSVEVAA